MSMSLAELRGVPHTSISQLKAFLQCPRRYRFQYIDRLEPAFRPIALAFGTAWHHAVGAYLLPPVKERGTTREEVHSTFRDSLMEEISSDGIPVVFDDVDDGVGPTLDLGIRMLDTFIEQVRVPREVLDVERAFVLELVHPVTGQTAPLPLIGAIDAIVINHEQTEIWEIKTGKKKWSADQLEYDPQPTAYLMAARELGHGDPIPKLLVTTKTSKPDVQVERLVRRRADECELTETVFDVLRAVNAGVDVRIRGWGCRSCAFAGVCGL